MIQAVIGYYLVRGLKASTIWGYLASIRNGHDVRGMECPALDEKLIHTIMKGAKNIESLQKTKPQGVVTMIVMKKLWAKFKNSNMSMDTKRLLWAIFNILFLGSLRPAEALSAKKAEYDEVKTLTWADVKMLSTCMDGKEVKFLQLTLKQPKTSRTMPTQIVEIPELGKQICAVKAFEKWKAGRKCKHDPSTPVFTMANGDLVTTGFINRVLASLLEDESPKITAKAFRPGLSTILAQQGANPEELKNLGRWTSRAFEVYIRRGRANNWRSARAQMLKATKNA
jgi:integrase